MTGEHTKGRAVERALALAEQRAGLGRGVGAPGWVRQRALGVLEGQAARTRIGLTEAADRLAHDKGALAELVDALRVGETRFYRDRAQWEALAERVLPAIASNVEIAALSAGCSTGEEAYTLAMIFANARRRFRVVGVDRSADALAAARLGEYETEATRELPSGWVARFFDAHAGGRLRVRRTLSSQVTFQECDLVQRTPRGPFHIVLFKNVLLYLAAPAGEDVVTRLSGELDPQGVLFTSASEVLRVRGTGLSAVRLGGVTAFRGPP